MPYFLEYVPSCICCKAERNPEAFFPKAPLHFSVSLVYSEVI